MKRHGLRPLCGPVAAIACFAAIVSPLHARIGETRAQIEARYHNVGKEVGDQVLYPAGEENVAVFYSAFDNPQAKATMEIYSRAKAADGTQPDFAPDQVEGVLSDEANGQKWTKVSAAKGSLWQRSDGYVFARFEETSQILVLIARDHQAVVPKDALLVNGKDGKAIPSAK